MLHLLMQKGVLREIEIASYRFKKTALKIDSFAQLYSYIFDYLLNPLNNV